MAPAVPAFAAANAAPDAVLLSTRRIWNSAPHNAFTDLTFYDDQFYVTFREASQHAVPPAGTAGGNIRVLRSSDGVNFSSTALFSMGTNNDLRDPKLSVSPDNRLILTATDSPQVTGVSRQSYGWTTTNGTTWSASTPIADPGRWMWRTEWNGNTSYGISYGNGTRLHTSTDGLNYTTVANLIPGNEAALVFSQVGPNKGTAYALIRATSDTDNAMFGTSTAASNYTAWTWKESTDFIGGPDLIELPDGRLIAGGRHILTRNADGTVATQDVALSLLDPTTGALTEFMTLPSSGDGGYPGLLWHDDKLYVSYYSSQSGKASIYLSVVAFTVPEPAFFPSACVFAGLLFLRPRRVFRHV